MFTCILLRCIHLLITTITFAYHSFSNVKITFWNLYRKLVASRVHTGPDKTKSNQAIRVKLPLHLGLLIFERQISFMDVANIISWAAASGIPYITVYDPYGEVKRNKMILEELISRRKNSLSSSESSLVNIRFHKSKITTLPCSTDSTTCKSSDVILLSLQDGRQDLVNTAQSICALAKKASYSLSNITSTCLDQRLQDLHGFPDPELLLKFGSVDSLMGYLPWQIRLTEILSIPSHQNFDYSSFTDVLENYAHLQQRFGK